MVRVLFEPGFVFVSMLLTETFHFDYRDCFGLAYASRFDFLNGKEVSTGYGGALWDKKLWRKNK